MKPVVRLIHHHADPISLLAQLPDHCVDRIVLFAIPACIAFVHGACGNRLPGGYEHIPSTTSGRRPVFLEFPDPNARKLPAQETGRLTHHALERSEPEPYHILLGREHLHDASRHECLARSGGRFQ